MKKITITELVLKIFGLVLIALGLPKLPWMVYCLISVLQSTTADIDTIASFAHSLSGILYIVLGIIIFILSPRISRRFLPIVEHPFEPLTPQILQDTIYSCVGLFIAMRSIPAIVSFFVTTVYLRNFGSSDGPGMMETTLGIGAVITFILGFSLFLRAKGLVGFRDHLRDLGKRRQS